MPTFNPPKLSGMPANVAGILPLSALIDFTDAERTLHSYQLSGRGLTWNWVITPACARLLISNDGTKACCLDQSGAVSILHCMDGRWGDAYPCSSPNTIRTCMEVATSTKINLPDDLAAGAGGDRPQRLRIVKVSLAQSKNGNGGRTLLVRIRKLGWYWVIVSVSGCVVFLAALVITVLAGLYIAASYLIVLLLTGIVVRFSHGHQARRITKLEPSTYRRLVIATDSHNGDEWTAFIGPGWLVNPLLNKPLHQINPSTYFDQLTWLLRILVILQWGLTVIACGYQDWNAFVVFAWIALCALISASVYGERASTKSWLLSNTLQLERAEVVLSCRRSMLSLLVALNPDKDTRWINPILAPSEERTAWEVALTGCLEKELWEERIQACLVCVPGPVKQQPDYPYWWKFTWEGLRIAEHLQHWLEQE